jgi:hypothetical protein
MEELQKYSKFIVGFLGFIAVWLTSSFTDETWLPVALSAIDAVLVYLVPNRSVA